VSGPSLVRFGRHARDRCHYYGRSPQEVADLILAEHDRRRRNPREADWLVSGRGLVVAYNWPDGEDSLTVRVVTLWPQR
jgi:hypothetical protein